MILCYRSESGKWGFLLHYVLGVPADGVSVEVSCGVKPEIELLLSVSLPLSEHIGMQNIRVTTKVSQELKVNLIMCWPLRGQLPNKRKTVSNHILMLLLIKVVFYFSVHNRIFKYF